MISVANCVMAAAIGRCFGIMNYLQIKKKHANPSALAVLGAVNLESVYHLLRPHCAAETQNSFQTGTMT